ncbi:hypothetical protein DPEC_G00360660 [Dallia pectoralis]|uniref:Uncharacterized protein n=1 Tax=Dallia pectoralis TaxID=75939 RepID=A0ACC2F0Z2_DALPE|nr:hypothetical protein DPEC_G00360660 [Dallia pectoralis]
MSVISPGRRTHRNTGWNGFNRSGEPVTRGLKMRLQLLLLLAREPPRAAADRLSSGPVVVLELSGVQLAECPLTQRETRVQVGESNVSTVSQRSPSAIVPVGQDTGVAVGR